MSGPGLGEEARLDLAELVLLDLGEKEPRSSSLLVSSLALHCGAGDLRAWETGEDLRE